MSVLAAPEAQLPGDAEGELLSALSDLLLAARAMKASRAEWEKRSAQVEHLLVKHGLAPPAGRATRTYVRKETSVCSQSVIG